MNHDLYKNGDANIPEVIKDRNGEVALRLCKRCGRAECELDEPCLTQQEQLEALAEQIRLLKEALSYCVEDSRYVLTTIETHCGSVHGERRIKAQQVDIDRAVSALALPDLSTSILNQRDARTLKEAAQKCLELASGKSHHDGVQCAAAINVMIEQRLCGFINPQIVSEKEKV